MQDVWFCMQSLPGFRDFYPEDFAVRNYVVSTWKRVARTYGFVEYDAPVLESSSLYEKKNSGGEILEQLYRFTDRGERDISLRPEMTPSLARMVCARGKQYRKPLKWFSVANFFRYERQQKGRLREFLQFNADILGEDGVGADAELIALTIDTLRAFGLEAGDFVVRLSDRNVWLQFLSTEGIGNEGAGDFLAVVDKLEREKPEVLEEKLTGFGTSLSAVKSFIATGGADAFRPLLQELQARGMQDFVEVDLTIVRGLAYYTGVVFEVFDRSGKFRALAGGGRYDHLISSLSDGAVDLSAIGMGMGDVVLTNFIQEKETASALQAAALAGDPACEIYVVLADEARRAEALAVVQQLRNAGRNVGFSLSSTKVGKQFQAAEGDGAAYAILIGAEWPEIKVKNMAARTEQVLAQDALADWAKTAQF